MFLYFHIASVVLWSGKGAYVGMTECDDFPNHEKNEY